MSKKTTTKNLDPDASSGRGESACSVSPEYLNSVKEALMDGMIDIDELLTVAKYNLRGEHCGQIVGKPETPKLIHEGGIAESERIREQMREAFKLTLYYIKQMESTPNV